jgi:hypothetical protein
VLAQGREIVKGLNLPAGGTRGSPAEPGVRCESIRPRSRSQLMDEWREAMGPGCAAPSARAGPFPVGGAGSDPTGEINHDADFLICKPVKYGS